MKKLFTLIAVLLITGKSYGQQNYCDFEGTKSIYFTQYNGVLDTVQVNPMTNTVNPSSLCAKYIRSADLYDNFKFFTYSKLTDVTPYASSTATNYITMKVYSSAPAGTQVDLQLGAKTVTTYPAGVHSIYTTTTSVSHAWEVLTFKYVSNPTGATIAATDIDKIVVLYHPNSSARDTVYFDDPTGPVATIIGVNEHTASQASFRLFQNIPNPATGSTQIKFEITSPGEVNLKLYNILGKEVRTLMNKKLNEGIHTVAIETSELGNGIYFYTLKKNGISQSMKMIITN